MYFQKHHNSLLTDFSQCILCMMSQNRPEMGKNGRRYSLFKGIGAELFGTNHTLAKVNVQQRVKRGKLCWWPLQKQDFIPRKIFFVSFFCCINWKFNFPPCFYLENEDVQDEKWGSKETYLWVTFQFFNFLRKLNSFLLMVNNLDRI